MYEFRNKKLKSKRFKFPFSSLNLRFTWADLKLFYIFDVGETHFETNAFLTTKVLTKTRHKVIVVKVFSEVS